MDQAAAQEPGEDENVCHQHSEGPDQGKVGLNRGVEKGLAAGVDLSGKKGTETKKRELDLPANGPGRRSEGALQIHENEDGAQQKNQLKSEPSPPERQGPLG